MAPVQIAVLPIADRHIEAADKLAAKLRDTLYDSRPKRVSVDHRSETLGKKIRDTQLQKVPLMLILGDRDIEQGTVGVRSRDEGDMGAVKLEELFGKVIA